MIDATSTPEADDPTIALWHDLNARLRRFLRARVPSDDIADDLLQETFLRIHEKVDTVADDERLTAWVFRIARNLVIDYYRSRDREEEPGDVETMFTPPHDDRSDNRNADVHAWLGGMIDALPAPGRDVVRMFELEGRAQADIAAHTGLSLSAVKAHVRRGRERLESMLHACCRFEVDRRGNVLDFERRGRGPCCDDGDAC